MPPTHGRSLPRKMNFIEDGTLNQILPGHHDGREVRAPHTGGEGAKRSVGAGVTVRSDHYIPRKHQALFRQQRMLDAHAPDFIIMGKLLFGGEFPEHFSLHCRGNVLVGDEMIGDQSDTLGVEDLFCSRPPKSLDGKGGGNIVAQGEIDIHFEELSRAKFRSAGMGGQDLFTNRHGHDLTFQNKGLSKNKLLSF